MREHREYRRLTAGDVEDNRGERGSMAIRDDGAKLHGTGVLEWYWAAGSFKGAGHLFLPANLQHRRGSLGLHVAGTRRQIKAWWRSGGLAKIGKAKTEGGRQNVSAMA